MSVIEGTFIDSETGNPIHSARISLYQEGEEMDRTATDWEGKFVFHNVSAGEYDLIASSVFYEPVKHHVKIGVDRKKSIELRSVKILL